MALIDNHKKLYVNLTCVVLLTCAGLRLQGHRAYHSRRPEGVAYKDKSSGADIQSHSHMMVRTPFVYMNQNTGASSAWDLLVKLTDDKGLNRTLSVFLDKTSIEYRTNMVYPLPFGLHGVSDNVKDILDALPARRDLCNKLNSMPSPSCLVVGNEGTLSAKRVGAIVDRFDIVIRVNDVKFHGIKKNNFAKKTSIQLVNPKGRTRQNFEHVNATIVFVAYKPVDLQRIDRIVKRVNRHKKKRLKSAAVASPEKTGDILLLNPAVVEEVAFKLFKYPLRKTKIHKTPNPTIEAVGVMLALHICNKVSIAGFSDILTSPVDNSNENKTENIRKTSDKFNIERRMMKAFIKHRIISSLMVDGV